MNLVKEAPDHLDGFVLTVDENLLEFEKGDESLPFHILREGVCISDHDKTMLGSCQGYIDTAFIVQESNLASIIASNC